jgi:hypothetical protein
MKKLQANKTGRSYQQKTFHMKTLVSLILFFLLVSGLQSFAQLPTLTVRFANPSYNCEDQTYCLDVEFQADAANLQLYGINVRFFYDDEVLEFISLGEFAEGYGPVSPNPPQITTGQASSGQTLFGFPTNHPAEYVNGAVQLLSSTSIFLPVGPDNWVKLFNVCFTIDDPDAAQGVESFCPSVVWDLEEDPANGGFDPVSNGVVMTTLVQLPDQSAPATENVVQFNWSYTAAGQGLFGNPDPQEETCISTICSSLDFGDAPEGSMAYPDLGIMGAFPTCLDPTLAGHVFHNVNFDGPIAFFGPTVDIELDGNSGICSPYGAPYNNDECFGASDPDAGLMFPGSYTVSGGAYSPCAFPDTLAMTAGDTLQWGVDLDIYITNNTPDIVYVNVLIDWNQNGMWDYDPTTLVEGNLILEHCLVDFPVYPGYVGPLSGLVPPDLYSGPNNGYVWARFSITEIPVSQFDNSVTIWDGSGEFLLGESEDYLFLVQNVEIPLSDWALVLGFILIAAFTVIRLRKS